MDLEWLKDFEALADHKTFSRAADARNVTQPAFSRRIRALEDWIGTPLFVRGAQGAVLTPAGRNFRTPAIDILRSLERTRRDARAIAEGDTGALSIAATHALSFTFFPGWIRRYMQSEGFGTLNLVSDSMEACEEIMLAGEVHFLLCHVHSDSPGRIEAERVSSHAVGTDTLVPLCAPDANGRPRWTLPGQPATPVPHLAYGSASGLGRILMATGAISSQHEAVFTSHLAATLMTMAREGHGVAWLPHTLAEEDCKTGALVRAAPSESDVPIEIRLFRSAACRNRASDAFWARVSGL